jgi:hypothetical protein
MTNNKKLTLFPRTLIVALWCLCSLPGLTRAAGLDIPKGEAVFYGGGVSVTGGGGTYGLVGGEIGGDIADRVHPFAEFNYIPLGSASLSSNSGGTYVQASASARMLDFGGGLQVNLRPKGSAAAPYLVAAFGEGHQSVSASGTGTSGSSTATVSMSESANNAYVGFGGGLRYFVSEHWGLRPEFRYQRYTSGGGDILMFSVGVFRRFGK